MGIGDLVKGKVGDKALKMLEDILGDIDLFDQLAEMLKTVVPLKLEITVKGKKALELRAMTKEGALFIKVTRIKEEKPEAVEATEEEHTEPAEKPLEGLENAEVEEAETEA